MKAINKTSSSIKQKKSRFKKGTIFDHLLAIFFYNALLIVSLISGGVILLRLLAEGNTRRTLSCLDKIQGDQVAVSLQEGSSQLLILLGQGFTAIVTAVVLAVSAILFFVWPILTASYFSKLTKKIVALVKLPKDVLSLSIIKVLFVGLAIILIDLAGLPVVVELAMWIFLTVGVLAAIIAHYFNRLKKRSYTDIW